MNKPNQKSSSTAAPSSAAQKPSAKPALKPVAQSSTGKPAAAPAKIADAPMHAAKGNDDTMSQPQASKTPQAKKKS